MEQSSCTVSNVNTASFQQIAHIQYRICRSDWMEFGLPGGYHLNHSLKGQLTDNKTDPPTSPILKHRSLRRLGDRGRYLTYLFWKFPEARYSTDAHKPLSIDCRGIAFMLRRDHPTIE